MLDSSILGTTHSVVARRYADTRIGFICFLLIRGPRCGFRLDGLTMGCRSPTPFDVECRERLEDRQHRVFFHVGIVLYEGFEVFEVFIRQ